MNQKGTHFLNISPLPWPRKRQRRDVDVRKLNQNVLDLREPNDREEKRREREKGPCKIPGSEQSEG